jgi:hypothetical protein
MLRLAGQNGVDIDDLSRINDVNRVTTTAKKTWSERASQDAAKQQCDAMRFCIREKIPRR